MVSLSDLSVRPNTLVCVCACVCVWRERERERERERFFISFLGVVGSGDGVV